MPEDGKQGIEADDDVVTAAEVPNCRPASESWKPCWQVD